MPQVVRTSDGLTLGEQTGSLEEPCFWHEESQRVMHKHRQQPPALRDCLSTVDVPFHACPGPWDSL